LRAGFKAGGIGGIRGSQRESLGDQSLGDRSWGDQFLRDQSLD
jgi:hypothetical protein